MRSAQIVAALVFTLVWIPAVSFAGDLPPDEQAFFDKHLSDIVEIEPTPLRTDATAAVFNVPLYAVKMTIHQGPDTQTMNLIAAKTDTKLLTMSSPGTDEDLPQFKSMISPQFKLNSGDDGQTFEKAIDVIDPIPDVSPDDQKAKAHSQQGTQWTFVRGTFFQKHKGYVVTTDDSGAIRSVKYSLNLP